MKYHILYQISVFETELPFGDISFWFLLINSCDLLPQITVGTFDLKMVLCDVKDFLSFGNNEL